jgi:hypothetical protein
MKEGIMSETAVGRTAEYIAESVGQASCLTSAVADAVQEGAQVVSRAAKKGGDAAEEFLTDATERMQHNLVLTMATTFAVGFTAGTLIGWMMRRRQSAL